MSVTYSECVSVVLSIQPANAHARYYIVICGLSVCSTFFHIISGGRRYEQMERRTDGRTDRQTYMTKLIVAFRNFANFTGRTQCVENLAKANRYSRWYFLLCGGLLILAEDKERIPDSITPITVLPSITFRLRVSHLAAFCSTV